MGPERCNILALAAMADLLLLYGSKMAILRGLEQSAHCRVAEIFTALRV